MTGNKYSGKTSKYQKVLNVQTILDGSAKEAAGILDRHINKIKGYVKLKPSLQRACEYVIDHAIGKARQKIEHSGGILTYGEIIKSIDKPRDILADVEELANKYQEKTSPGSATDTGK